MSSKEKKGNPKSKELDDSIIRERIEEGSKVLKHHVKERGEKGYSNTEIFKGIQTKSP